jgi:hypothetical protein
VLHTSLYKCPQLRPHPFALEIPDVELEVANRPKTIRIHLALSRGRFYLFWFNSSGNVCDGGAIRSRGTPYPNPHHNFRGCGISPRGIDFHVL